MLTEGEGARRSWLGGGSTATGRRRRVLGVQWMSTATSEACEAPAAPQPSIPAAKTKMDLRWFDSRGRVGSRRLRGSTMTTCNWRRAVVQSFQKTERKREKERLPGDERRLLRGSDLARSEREVPGVDSS